MLNLLYVIIQYSYNIFILFTSMLYHLNYAICAAEFYESLFLLSYTHLCTVDRLFTQLALFVAHLHAHPAVGVGAFSSTSAEWGGALWIQLVPQLVLVVLDPWRGGDLSLSGSCRPHPMGRDLCCSPILRPGSGRSPQLRSRGVVPRLCHRKLDSAHAGALVCHFFLQSLVEVNQAILAWSF